MFLITLVDILFSVLWWMFVLRFLLSWLPNLDGAIQLLSGSTA